MTRIKICGITNQEDASRAVGLGADALGFIFTESAREISPEKAKKIVVRLPPFVLKVGVFKNERISRIREIKETCSLDLLQLHGEEDRSYLEAFGQKALKVFDVSQRNVLNRIRRLSLPFFMLDLPKGKKAGISTYWREIQEAKKMGRIILAGGLDVWNIERILHRIRPYGVDVCRGVEKEEGVKCPDKLKAFIVKVRQWDIQNM